MGVWPGKEMTQGSRCGEESREGGAASALPPRRVAALPQGC